MIVRITRGRIRPNNEGEAFEIVRQMMEATGGTRPDGLEAVFLSRRAEGATIVIVSVTVWRDTEALTRVLGAAWTAPSFPPALAALLLESSVEHLETVAESFEDLALVGATA